jgi:hypothetical protein
MTSRVSGSGPRSRPAGVEGRERGDLAHQAADDALLAIAGKLDRFRGDSRFATCAIVVDGIRSTRNALYKTMFDARRKIRAHLVAHGYLDDEEPRKT